MPTGKKVDFTAATARARHIRELYKQLGGGKIGAFSISGAGERWAGLNITSVGGR